jgi:hypothetical protein
MPIESPEYDIRELVQKVDKVLSYIQNDDTTGRKGLFAQVEENKQNIEELQRGTYVRKGVMMGWGAAGSIIVILIKIIFDSIDK